MHNTIQKRDQSAHTDRKTVNLLLSLLLLLCCLIECQISKLHHADKRKVIRSYNSLANKEYIKRKLVYIVDNLQGYKIAYFLEVGSYKEVIID